MGHCENCKWWASEQEFEPIKMGTCDQPKQIVGYSWKPEDMPIDGLVTEGDEGWGWYTGPRFGCVNFETKEKQAQPTVG